MPVGWIEEKKKVNVVEMYGIEKKKQKRFIDLNVPLRVMTGYCFEMLY